MSAMEYCSAVKKNEAIHFAGKWIQTEKIILSEGIDPETQMSHVTPHLSLLAPNLQM